MIRNEISPAQVVEVLNRALEVDPEAMKKFVDFRAPCNVELSNDPEIQVACYADGTQTLSFLGLLNGLFGSTYDGWGALQAIYKLKCSSDESHEIQHGKILSDPCSDCGSEIVVGDLVEFSLCPHAF